MKNRDHGQGETDNELTTLLAGKQQPAQWVSFLHGCTEWLQQPCVNHLPCPAFCQTRQCINLHKMMVLPIYLACIYYHYYLAGDEKPSWFLAAMVLLPWHSVYGICWNFKDYHFGDAQWKKNMSLCGFCLFGLVLGLYYLPMYCLTSRQCPGGTFAEGHENWVILSGSVFYLFGFFFLFGSDAQKYYTFTYQNPRGLITDGFFQYCRNPNYLGEIMIYTGFAILSTSYIVLPCFAVVWVCVFLPNMKLKDASMSRYPEWQAWADRTPLVFPNLKAFVADLYVESLRKRP